MSRDVSSSPPPPLPRAAAFPTKPRRFGVRCSFVLAVIGFFAMTASPSVAATPAGYHFLETFGTAAKPGFAAPEGVVVDPTSGGVLVIDRGGNEKQAIRFPASPSWVAGDKFRLKNLNPSKCSPTSTGEIEFGAVVALRENVKNALGAGCGGPSNFVVAGNANTGLTVEFVGVLAGESQPLMELEPVVVSNPGATGSVERFAAAHTSGVYRYAENGEPNNFSSTNVIDQGAIFAEKGFAQVAVDSSGGATDGNIYVAAGGIEPVRIYSSTGAELGTLTESSEGAFGEACGIAVDASGAVFVGDRSGMVHRYQASGAVPTNADNSGNFTAEGACSIATGAGSIFVVENVAPGAGGSKVAKLNAATGVEEGSRAMSSTTVASNPGTGHVYVAGESRITELEWPASSPVVISETPLSGSTPFATGVGANDATGRLLTTKNNGPNVEVWAPSAQRTITITVSGSGAVSQSTSSTPPVSGAILNCTSAGGSNCTATYLVGDEPEFEATADPNNQLVAWTIEHAESTTCSGAASPCKIQLKSEPGAENVTAIVEFALSGSALTVETEGNGVVEGGSVAHPASIKCGTGGTECSFLYPEEIVTLVAEADQPGNEFSGWTNPALCVNPSPDSEHLCEFTISAATTIKAVFSQEPPTIAAVNPGGGSEAGGNTVSIEGTNLGGATAVTFGGAAATITSDTFSAVEVIVPSHSAGPVDVVVVTPGGQATAATAYTYEPLANPATLRAFKGGSGAGVVISVSPNPAIDCGTICESIYEAGEIVTLEATPNAGAAFGGWIGCNPVVGEESKCRIKLSGAETDVTAIFVSVPVVTAFTAADEEAGSPPGEPCHLNGGTAIEYQGTTTYVCNGRIGADGNSVVTRTFTGEKTVGSISCQEGGLEVEVEGQPLSLTLICNGKQGVDGERGERGQIGLVGVEGPAGATGAQGPSGGAGAAGPPGTGGQAGPQGAQGKTGPKGADGKVTVRCKVKSSRKVTCTVEHAKRGKSAQRRPVKWNLRSHGRVVSRGRSTVRRLSSVLSHLDPGAYLLRVEHQLIKIVVPPGRP